MRKVSRKFSIASIRSIELNSTPAEACGIDLEMKNGWEDLIRDATYYQTKLTRFISSSVEADFR